ncbi:hypothetical protein GYMLUDRAFT_556670 [Collybiopsis luxurians FD-317 M1]|uniref:Uncharacterized protein n=1 Tax=Collybiopsis luxurians FD-317 M1 TaxID=944289 RepID=A0A0D0BWP2_9AGAR|nr:hypothetical protein GYMLUDRAFT_556670 [Collybiopsis luxurians FD-317 M1]
MISNCDDNNDFHVHDLRTIICFERVLSRTLRFLSLSCIYIIRTQIPMPLYPTISTYKYWFATIVLRRCARTFSLSLFF